jgi:hypothetical protein
MLADWVTLEELLGFSGLQYSSQENQKVGLDCLKDAFLLQLCS